MGMRIGVSSAFLAVVFASAAAAENDARASAVIQGRGKDVSIVYRAPRAAAPEKLRAADPLAEALRRKKNGADDTAIVDYLRQNEAALPDVVDAGTLRALRRAGAGDSVIAAISSRAAVDIGPTAEETAAPVPIPEPSTYVGAYPELANLGYPFYGDGGYGGGGYGGGNGGGWHGRGRFVDHHGSHGHDGRGAFFRFQQPSFHFGFGNGGHMGHGGHGGPGGHGGHGGHGGSMSGRMR